MGPRFRTASSFPIIPVFSVFLVLILPEKKTSGDLCPISQVKLVQSNDCLCAYKDPTFPGLLQL